MQCWGAKSLADDLATGQGVVFSRAASTLRSVETQPLIGWFVYLCIIVGPHIRNGQWPCDFWVIWLLPFFFREIPPRRSSRKFLILRPCEPKGSQGISYLVSFFFKPCEPRGSQGFFFRLTLSLAILAVLAGFFMPCEPRAPEQQLGLPLAYCLPLAPLVHKAFFFVSLFVFTQFLLFCLVLPVLAVFWPYCQYLGS